MAASLVSATVLSQNHVLAAGVAFGAAALVAGIGGQRRLAMACAVLVIPGTWLAVRFLVSACNLGDPLQQGSGAVASCQHATAVAPAIATAYAAAVGCAVLLGTLGSRLSSSAGTRALAGIGLVLAVLPVLPAAWVYVAAQGL